ncbi:MAG TPA: VWA domain-containing protein [Thermoanaerobaculia bacterium]|jgi:VWFA-related protein|nr:VWA domain-containing protein [Thermoanaerobaculia bacterium]
MRRIGTAILLASGLIASFRPASAQTAEPVSAFGDVVEVRVVNLEVAVTDAEGRRVQGLQRGDFRLLVDGKEVPIHYFTEVREGQALVADAATGAAPAAPPALADGGAVGTSYLVFIDDLFSLRVRRDEVLKSLKAEVARLGPADRMAIVAYDGKRLERLSPWSGSATELTSALDAAMARKAHGIEQKAELNAMESSRRLSTNLPAVGTVGNAPDVSPGGAGTRPLDLDQIAYTQQVTDRLERAVMAAVSTLRAFASAPGRKVMLLLAGGWPYSASGYASNSFGPVYDPRLPWHKEHFAPLTDTANRLGYTIYPVDVPGLEAVGPDASSAVSSFGEWDVRENEIHSALTYIASRTGGLALINAGRRNALSRAQADTRSYYWLGVSPSWRQNDQRHRMQVEVLRPGLKVRSRNGVLDMSRQTEVTMMVEQALLFGGAGTAKMPMEVGKPARSGRKEMEVPVSLAIPLSSITVLPVDRKYSTDLELRFAAMDEHGDRSDVPMIPLHLSFDTPPPAGGGHIRYDTRVKLRRIEQHLIATLFDPLSGKITTAEVDVAP